MIAVILAGGEGTRLTNFNKLPKALVPIAGKPILQHQIEFLQEYGFTEIYILVHHLSQQIINYFENGRRFGVRIHYINEKWPLGTAGALYPLKNLIHEPFLILYGDIMINFDISRFTKFHKTCTGSLCTLVVHPNTHPYDSDLIEMDSNNKIITFHPKPHKDQKWYRNLVSAGVYVCSPLIFPFIKKSEFADFGKDLFPRILLKGKKLYAYSTAEYLLDMGTPERLLEVQSDLISGKISKLHGKNRRKAVFIDRDGVIIKQVDQLSHAEDVTLIKNVPEAISLLNSSEYLALTVTNQPMIAKGYLNFKELSTIHNKIDTLLGYHKAKLDGIYFCPHHPDTGFFGEIPEYKIKCGCRKPSPGMIFQAAVDFNVDLENSYFIGDSTTDVMTAQNAGLKSILVKTGFAGKDLKFDIKPDFVRKDLLDAVKGILYG